MIAYKRMTGYRNFMNQRAYWPVMRDVRTDKGAVPGAISASGVVYWCSKMGWRKLKSASSRCIREPEIKGKIEIPVPKAVQGASPHSKIDKPEKHWLRKAMEFLFNKGPKQNRR